MSEEKNAVEKLYENPKAKGFINHLVRAYLPVYKIAKVWSFKGTQKHRCSICGAKLFDIETAMTNLMKNDEKLREEFAPFLLKQINGEKIKIEDYPMYKYVTQGKVQAFTGEKTDTCICQSCAKDLLNLVEIGLLNGDKNFVWITNKMRREEVFGAFKNSESLLPNEKEKVREIEKRVEKTQEKKITTFGDLKALQDLKAKMESEEKEKS
jgi:hypothetical protein